MQLLFTILIYGLIQLLPLTPGNPLPPISAKENFLEFYENELNIMAEDFCENAKNLSEKLLLEKDIKEALLPETKEFKIFLQDFLQDYPHYKRFKIYQPLLAILINIAKIENCKENTDLKFQQIVTQYFANILKEYEQNYKKFINEKLLNKSEEFKNQLSPQDIKQMPKYNELIDKLKVCQDIQCFPTNSDSILKAINATEDVATKFLKIDSNKLFTLLHIYIGKLGKLMLKDEQFSALNLATKQNLTHDINHYCTKFANSSDIEDFGILVNEKLNFPKKYLNNMMGLPLKDHVILKEIFEKNSADIFKTKFQLGNKAVMGNLVLKLLFMR